MSAKTVAVLFPGDMGSGLSRLLRAHSFRVISNLRERSARTQELAKAAGVEDVGSDAELLTYAKVIISVLVPSKAYETAQRIASVCRQLDRNHLQTQFFIDANAVAPTTTQKIASLFEQSGIEFIDGSIIGGSPHLKPDGTWYRPTFAVSGPRTREIGLDETFDISHVGPDIGQASALKMSFASLTKVR
jgi:3-hydroxyisobutyrate dehydrogenase-like beta-hydroxyacid dehydrogenase